MSKKEKIQNDEGIILGLLIPFIFIVIIFIYIILEIQGYVK